MQFSAEFRLAAIAANARDAYRDLEEPRGRQGTPRGSTRTSMGAEIFGEFGIRLKPT